MPAFRVGNQPYGVLPTTAYGAYAPDPAEALGGRPAAERSASRFDRVLHATAAPVAGRLGAAARGARQARAQPGASRSRTSTRSALPRRCSGWTRRRRRPLPVRGQRRQPRHAVDAPRWASGCRRPRAPIPAAPRSWARSGCSSASSSRSRDAYGLPAGPAARRTGKVARCVRGVLRAPERPRAPTSCGCCAAPSRCAARVAGSDPPAISAALLTRLGAGPGGRRRAAAPITAARCCSCSPATRCCVELREAALRILAVEGMVDDAGPRARGRLDATTSLQTLTTTSRRRRGRYLFAPARRTSTTASGSSSRGAGRSRPTSARRSMADYLAARGDNALVHGFPGERGPSRRARRAAGRTRRPSSALRTIPRGAPRRARDGAARPRAAHRARRLDDRARPAAAGRDARGTRRAASTLGAYGWVEDLRPDAAPPAAERRPARAGRTAGTPAEQRRARTTASSRRRRRPCRDRRDPAQRLRLAAGRGGVAERMAVNLSSRRVRVALALIEGVRAGNDLGALLGYRLERFLHEYTRRRRRHARRRDRAAAARVPDRRGGRRRQRRRGGRAERQVVDGLAVVEDGAGRHPPRRRGRRRRAHACSRCCRRRSLHALAVGAASAGSARSPAPTSAAALEGVVRAIDHVADALDAVGDVVVAESVHQIALGNHAARPRPRRRAGRGEGAAARPRSCARRAAACRSRTGCSLQLAVAPAPAPRRAGRACRVTPRAAAEPTLQRLAGRACSGAPAEPACARRRRPGDGGRATSTSSRSGSSRSTCWRSSGPGFEERAGRPAGARARRAAARPTSTTSTRRRRCSVEPGRGAELGPEPAQPRRGGAAAGGRRTRCSGAAAPRRRATTCWPRRARPRGDTRRDGRRAGAARRAAARDGARRRRGARPAAGRRRDARRGRAGRRPAGVRAAATCTPAPTTPRALRDRRVLGAARRARRRPGRRGFGVQVRAAVALRRARRGVAQTLLEAAADRASSSSRGRAGRGRRRAGRRAATRGGAARPRPRALLGEGVAMLPQIELRNAQELADGAGRGARRARRARRLAARAPPPCARAPRHLADALALGDALGAARPRALAAVQLPHVAGEPWLGGALPDAAAAAGRLSLVVARPGRAARRRRRRRGAAGRRVDRARAAARGDDRRGDPLRPARRDRAAVRAAGGAAAARRRLAPGGPRRNAARDARAGAQPHGRARAPASTTSTASCCRRSSASWCPRRSARRRSRPARA